MNELLHKKSMNNYSRHKTRTLISTKLWFHTSTSYLTTRYLWWSKVKVQAKYHQHKSQNRQKSFHHVCPHKKQTLLSPQMFSTPTKTHIFRGEGRIPDGGFAKKFPEIREIPSVSVYIQVLLLKKCHWIHSPEFRKTKNHMEWPSGKKTFKREFFESRVPDSEKKTELRKGEITQQLFFPRTFGVRFSSLGTRMLARGRWRFRLWSWNLVVVTNEDNPNCWEPFSSGETNPSRKFDVDFGAIHTSSKREEKTTGLVTTVRKTRTMHFFEGNPLQTYHRF